MKHPIFILIILSLSVFATSCRTGKTASVSTYAVTDSLHISEFHNIAAQSVFKDSVAVERVVYVRDSVILTADTSGNIIDSRRFRFVDSNSSRERSRDRLEEKTLKDSVAGKQSAVVVTQKETAVSAAEKRTGWRDKIRNIIGDIITIATTLIVVASFYRLASRKE